MVQLAAVLKQVAGTQHVLHLLPDQSFAMSWWPCKHGEAYTQTVILRRSFVKMSFVGNLFILAAGYVADAVTICQRYVCMPSALPLGTDQH